MSHFFYACTKFLSDKISCKYLTISILYPLSTAKLRTSLALFLQHIQTPTKNLLQGLF